jgi:outer membrane immunogenic protein
MRLTSLALLASLLSTTAMAADYLPPPPPIDEPIGRVEFNWGGIYGGIHVGIGNADFDADKVAQQTAADAFRQSIVEQQGINLSYLGSTADTGAGYGGFVGYNWLWEDVVVGLEADTMFFSPKLEGSQGYNNAKRYDATTSLGYDISVTSAAAYQLNSLSLLKLRFGFPIGRVMPFATVGFALGHGSVKGSTTQTTVEYAIGADPVTGAPIYTPTGNGENRIGAVNKTGWVTGGAVGLGVDFAPLDNILFRAEYQWVPLSEFKGLSTNVNVFRLGAGIKY